MTTFGSVYVTADPARAGCALVTIAASNLDEHATALAARGLSLDELGADSRALRQLTITDDDGSCIKFFAGSRTAHRVSHRSSAPVFGM